MEEWAGPDQRREIADEQVILNVINMESIGFGPQEIIDAMLRRVKLLEHLIRQFPKEEDAP